MSGSHLFSPLTLRGLTLWNRIAVSPMCQYSAVNGFANEWHLVHAGTRAVGGAGMVILEATAVEPRGRITPGDLGIWSDDHVAPLRRIAGFIRKQGSAAAVQIGHAGRKASCEVPWKGGRQLELDEGGWGTVAPSPLPFQAGDRPPAQLPLDEIHRLPELFAEGARRAAEADFDAVEIHGAHGYLMGGFLSPLSNRRTDEYGGAFENRTRLLLEVVDAVRSVWPAGKPLLLRVSCTDWVEGGWTIDETVRLATLVKQRGVDLLDCSSGGLMAEARVPFGRGYQVPFAARVRSETGLATAAVGLITEPRHAEEIVATGQADLVLMAREFLRNPYWPIHAAKELGAAPRIPNQYLRAF